MDRRPGRLTLSTGQKEGEKSEDQRYASQGALQAVAKKRQHQQKEVFKNHGRTVAKGTNSTGETQEKSTPSAGEGEGCRHDVVGVGKEKKIRRRGKRGGWTRDQGERTGLLSDGVLQKPFLVRLSGGKLPNLYE